MREKRVCSKENSCSAAYRVQCKLRQELKWVDFLKRQRVTWKLISEIEYIVKFYPGSCPRLLDELIYRKDAIEYYATA